ncbi:acyltransferase family protein [Nocardioides sp. R-C-SC26]|uniref:acyltransferase family protein n=1 Tax=Nocardioides sp. R-C-SC26 TaxID=2870414 RepID=UPI001E3E70CB|nr:acyltransferase family protein [Nocardioides sp. R-C-SC26]
MSTSTPEAAPKADRVPAKDKLVTAAPPSKTRAEYRPDIDGIRGAAAIMVMGFHAQVPGFEGAYIGLDLFFVVSGYVITGLLMYEFGKTGRIKWGAFYARRARRLIPAKATMLIGVLALSYFIATPNGAKQTAQSAAAAAGFFSNFYFWQQDDVDYFGHQPGTGVLLHTWSLSVEEQFYLALPVLILVAWLVAKLLRVELMRTLLLTCVILTVASLWLAIVWADPYPKAAYYMPITRAFEFLMGVALALVVRKIRVSYDLREVMGLAGVAICAFVIWKPMPTDGYPSYWALLPTTAAVLMTWAGVGGPTIVTRFLSWKLLVWLGLLSYGWYLWHWPFLVLGEAYNLATPPLWARVVLIMAALGVSWLSYRFIEGRFYKRSGQVSATGKTWGSRRVIIAGVLSMATVAGLAGGAVALNDERAKSPAWQKVDEWQKDVPKMPAECLGSTFIPDRPQQCRLTDFDRKAPTVVLWGDSHAWMYIPGIQAAARKRNVNLVAFVMGACPPYIPPDDSTIACSRNNQMALDFVQRLADRKPPVRVIASASWETYRGSSTPGLIQEGALDGNQSQYIENIAQLFNGGVDDWFETVGSLGIDVDIVGPTPTIPREAPTCEAVPRPYSCDVQRDKAILDEEENVTWLKEQMAEYFPDTSRFIDVTKSLCNESLCFAENQGVLYYFDDNHISAQMSRRLKKQFAPSIRAVS